MKPLSAFGEMMRTLCDTAEHLLTHDVKAEFAEKLAEQRRILIAKRDSGGKRVVTSEGSEVE